MSIEWLAGILEGEGCFYWGRQRVQNGKYVYGEPKVALKMTDKDIVDRVAEMWGTTVRKVKTKDGCKTAWTTCRNGKPAFEVMFSVFPHMGERRRSKISELLGMWEHGVI